MRRNDGEVMNLKDASEIEGLGMESRATHYLVLGRRMGKSEVEMNQLWVSHLAVLWWLHLSMWLASGCDGGSESQNESKLLNKDA